MTNMTTRDGIRVGFVLLGTYFLVGALSFGAKVLIPQHPDAPSVWREQLSFVAPLVLALAGLGLLLIAAGWRLAGRLASAGEGPSLLYVGLCLLGVYYVSTGLIPLSLPSSWSFSLDEGLAIEDSPKLLFAGARIALGLTVLFSARSLTTRFERPGVGTGEREDHERLIRAGAVLMGLYFGIEGLVGLASWTSLPRPAETVRLDTSIWGPTLADSVGRCVLGSALFTGATKVARLATGGTEWQRALQ